MTMKIIKSIICILISTACISNLNAQMQDSCNYCEVYRRAYYLKSPDTINQILLNPNFNLSNKDKAELYGIRSLLTYRLSPKNDSQIIKDSILNDINISTSFLSGDENIKYLYRRHLTRTHQLDLNPLEEDVIQLKQKGYKSEKSGLGLRILLRKDKDYWGGIELALISEIEPTYKIKVGSTLVGRNLITTAYSALIFGYTKNLEQDLQELKFSFLKIESPIYLDIFQFGIIDNLSDERYFYRPEIGFSNWGFSLSYSINLYLNKSDNFKPNRHAINLRYLYTFNKK